MRAICVDDEERQREGTAAMLRQLPRISEVLCFAGGEEALSWLNGGNRADLALLDIHMPGMNGMELAAQIKTQWPGLPIVFLTAWPQYALEAFELRASGYIMKPATLPRLAEEVEFALARRTRREQGRVEIRTFGSFNVFVDGKAVPFRQARSKELLAYLVDRRGSGVTRREAFAILWEDRPYDRPMQKQLDGIIRGLRATLQEYGIDWIFEMKGGVMRLLPEHVRCDLYRFCRGDPLSRREYRGEYMNGYSWAEETESYMTGKVDWENKAQ